MPLVKIQIPDKKQSAAALMLLSERGRVDCFAEDVYVIPESALRLLKSNGIAFEELDRGGIDYAEKTLRDTLAAHSQRRQASRPPEVLSDA